MATLTIEIDPALRRQLDETAALDGVETPEQLVARMLPRWLERYRELWESVEEGRRDIREGRGLSEEDVFDGLEARLRALIAAEKPVAAE